MVGGPSAMLLPVVQSFFNLQSGHGDALIQNIAFVTFEQAALDRLEPNDPNEFALDITDDESAVVVAISQHWNDSSGEQGHAELCPREGSHYEIVPNRAHECPRDEPQCASISDQQSGRCH